MKTLVCVQGFAPAQETIRLNAPFYEKSGCDLVGVDGVDSEVKCWPGCFRYAVAIPPAREDTRWFHPRRLMNTFNEVSRLDYDWFIFTEYDSIFLKAVPDMEHLGDGFGAFIAGYCPEKWNCGSGPFLHPPFVMALATLGRWITAAAKMIMAGRFGNGTPDVFAALVCDEAKILIQNLEGVWSTNGQDMRVASKMMWAREAARNGCWHIHGVKRLDHRQYILGETDVFPADTIME